MTPCVQCNMLLIPDPLGGLGLYPIAFITLMENLFAVLCMTGTFAIVYYVSVAFVCVIDPFEQVLVNVLLRMLW